jgi:translation initiation factor 3 subunit C
MSRFFTASDSSSESSSEEELYSEEEEQSEEESEEQESEDESEEDESDEEEGKTGASKFLKEASDEEESEDEERVTVVKSAKDKRYEELEGTIRLIENAEKINDWAVISSGKFRENTWYLEHNLTVTNRIRQVEPPDTSAHQAERWQDSKTIHQSYCGP